MLEKTTSEKISENIEKLNQICAEVQEALEKHKVLPEVEVQLVGSIAKGTWLPGVSDIDFFLKFPVEFDEKAMVTTAELITRNAFEELGINPIPMNASHPYIKGDYKGYDVDVVPCYKIGKGDEIISAVDRTPLHTQYIIDNLEGYQKGEVRLLKAFMKELKIYGAETSVKGFSGYLCELLILKYGNFLETLKAARKWGEITVIDLEGYGTYADFLKESRLIVIDPVDKRRNVAAAVSNTAYSKMIVYSELFKNESRVRDDTEVLDFFSKRGTKVFITQVPRHDMDSDDREWDHAERMRKAAIRDLDKHGFGVVGSDFDVGQFFVAYLFEVEVSELPRIKKHQGPPVWNYEGRLAFIKKHRTFFIEGDHVYTFIPRKFTDAMSLLVKSLGHTYALKPEIIAHLNTRIANKYINKVITWNE